MVLPQHLNVKKHLKAKEAFHFKWNVILDIRRFVNRSSCYQSLSLSTGACTIKLFIPVIIAVS
jgi:hypothetical protein